MATGERAGEEDKGEEPPLQAAASSLRELFEWLLGLIRSSNLNLIFSAFIYENVFFQGLCSRIIATTHQQSVVMALTDTLNQHPHLKLGIKRKSARFTAGRSIQAFKNEIWFRDRGDGVLREDLDPEQQG